MNYQSIRIFSNLRKQSKRLSFESLKFFDKINIEQVIAIVFLKLATKKDYETIIMLFEHFAILNQSKKNDKYLICLANNNLIIDIATIAFENYNKFYKKIKRESPTIEKLE